MTLAMNLQINPFHTNAGHTLFGQNSCFYEWCYPCSVQGEWSAPNQPLDSSASRFPEDSALFLTAHMLGKHGIWKQHGNTTLIARNLSVNNVSYQVNNSKESNLRPILSAKLTLSVVNSRLVLYEMGLNYRIPKTVQCMPSLSWKNRTLVGGSHLCIKVVVSLAKSIQRANWM